ncbi:hypothetical protein [Pedobacter steynii]|nr:hypothetical protein [Pedobacter steynii]
MMIRIKNMTKFTEISFDVLCVIVVVFFLTSCTQDISFEKTKWAEKADPIYPSAYRSQMLKDLTTNHKLIGLSYSQLIGYLGYPDSKEANTVVYRIAIDYGSDIDPVYSKNLEFSYSKDSIITSFKILEWKK